MYIFEALKFNSQNSECEIHSEKICIKHPGQQGPSTHFIIIFQFFFIYLFISGNGISQ